MKKLLIASFFFIATNGFSQVWPSVASCIYYWTAFQLDTSGNNMYIGGQSTLFNTQTVNYIAKWDGVNATALGNGMSGGNSIQVSALTYFNGDLIAGGRFDSSGTVLSNNIAKWNGSGWQALGQGTNGAVSSLKVYAGELYVGGYFNMAGNIPAVGIAKWNGSAWTAVGSGFADSVIRMETFNNDLYVATAHAKIYKWDGSTWTYMMDFDCNTPFCSAQIFCMKNLYNTKLYVGGYFDAANNSTLPVNNIAQFDGTNWSDVGQASFLQPQVWDPVGAMTEKNGMLYITGEFDSINNMFANSFAMWDGVSWQTLGSGPYDGAAIEIFQGDIYIGARNNLRRLDSTLAVPEILAKHIKINIFPVPAAGSISVTITGNERIASIIIYDIMGKKMPDFPAIKNNDLDISSLAAGIYLLEAITEKQEKYFAKMVKQ